jgi:hypothetical protein
MTWLARAALLCAAWHVACGPSVIRDPQVITLPAASARTETVAAWDYPAAFAAIVSALERQIGVPRLDVNLLLFPDRRSFEAGLIASGHDPDSARRVSAAFQAVGSADVVLANEGSFHGLTWRDRVQLIAHELVHSVQYRLGGGRRGTSEQWLREGFAELVSIQVVEQLELGEAASLRAQFIGRHADFLRTAAAASRPPVPFAELSTFAQWTAAQPRAGIPLYLQAFVAAEWLVERHGPEAVVRYFSLFAASQERAGNFEQAFGCSLADFDRAFGARWQAVLAQARVLI